MRKTRKGKLICSPVMMLDHFLILAKRACSIRNCCKEADAIFFLTKFLFFFLCVCVCLFP